MRTVLAPLANQISITFDNVISTAVQEGMGRERNPTPREISEALKNHHIWNDPELDALVGLSHAVSKSLRSAIEVMKPVEVGRIPSLLSFAHPSYVMRRPPSERDQYAHDLRQGLIELHNR